MYVKAVAAGQYIKLLNSAAKFKAAFAAKITIAMQLKSEPSGDGIL